MPNLIDPNEMMYTSFQPKVARDFICRIDGFPAFLIKKADRPKFDQAEIELPHINVTQKIKGKTKWQNVSLELYDPIAPSGTQIIMEWQNLHHETATGRDGYQDFYKKDVIYQTLGPVNDIVEEWKLVGAFIVSADFGTLDYGDDSGIVTINLTLAYDRAILNF